MTKLLTQSDTSSENKAGRTVGRQLAVKEGRWVATRADVFRDVAIMDALHNPLSICDGHFMAKVHATK